MAKPSVPPRDLLLTFWDAYMILFRRLGPIFPEVPDAELTSWWRHPWKNAQVGGHPHSQHLWGFAIDLDCWDLPKLYAAASKTELFAVQEQTHVHVQLFPAGVLADYGFYTHDALWKLEQLALRA